MTKMTVSIVAVGVANSALSTMNSTDAALAWLLSVSSTCASSPFRQSSESPDPLAADWLPGSSSPCPTGNLNSDVFLSLDSTLVNSPSFAFVSDDCPLPSSSLFHSPSLTGVLTNSPFGNYLNLYDPLPSLSFSDVSPVIRASRNQDDPPLLEKENQVPKKRKKVSKHRNVSSFLENLHSEAPPAIRLLASPSRPLPPQLSSDLTLLDHSSASLPVLLSPVKLPLAIPAPIFTTPPRPSPFNPPLPPLSPLTPLSSLTDEEPSQSQSLKIKIVLKRKHPDANPCTPVKRTKRPRRSHPLIFYPSSPEFDPSPEPRDASPASDDGLDAFDGDDSHPVYSNRTLPTNIEVSSAFPLLYRRFPVSTYYQPPDAE